MIIDAHQHFWQLGRFEYPWMKSDVEVLYRDYLPEQLEPVLKENGVSSTVLVQASNSVSETRWLLELANTYPFIAGVVGWVDLESPEVDQQLDEFTAYPKFKGVRHLVESEPDDDWLVRPAVLNGLRQVAGSGVTYDLLVHTRHLKHVARLADACPDLLMVIDHMAKPPIASREFDSWFRELKPVAANPNVYCKLSGLVTEAKWDSWHTDDLGPYVDAAFELFGPDRLMFGSDHPVCLLAASYARVLDSFHELSQDLPDDAHQQIFSRNAIDFYRLKLDG